MKREWLAFILGLVVSSLFGLSAWLLMPESQNYTLYYHQVGIYANANNANNAISQLQSIGIDGYALHKDNQDYIICGLVLDQAESDVIASSLSGAGMPVLEKHLTIDEETKTKLENGEIEAVIETMGAD